ncbi:MAG: type II toxin-antitoxin system VapC family toxin, partial [Bdellovibrionota bacterium]
KLRLPCSPEEYVLSRIQEERFTELPISARHALRVSALPDHHRDPFDRILIAQSLGEGIPLLTADRQLAKYDAEILWADGEQRR